MVVEEQDINPELLGRNFMNEARGAWSSFKNITGSRPKKAVRAAKSFFTWSNPITAQIELFKRAKKALEAKKRRRLSGEEVELLGSWVSDFWKKKVAPLTKKAGAEISKQAKTASFAVSTPGGVSFSRVPKTQEDSSDVPTAPGAGSGAMDFIKRHKLIIGGVAAVAVAAFVLTRRK